MSVLNVKTENQTLIRWVEKTAALTQADRVHWCDGSQSEYDGFIRQMLADGTLIELNQQKWPGCYLHRSNPNDVARTESLTFICAPNKEDVGPTNNWMSPQEAHEKVGGLFKGCMKGRTMYVIPYVMGPIGGAISKFGVQITDSLYVVANMRIMTRIGQQALDHLGNGEEIVYGMHSIGELDPNRRFIVHLPQERLIMSYGSGYGGNALLGKKCFALRLASVMAKEQGWMAEHMLILGIEEPSGETTYMTAAFPSACGKTNLAMLVPPDSKKQYKIRTIGDDIAWLRPDAEGRLWAINPEAGFFGVAPGTSVKTNPNAMATLSRNTIFTNVAMTPEGEPWWEGMSDPPKQATDWMGQPWTPDCGRKAAHPNSRFTSPASQCPCISKHWDDPKGVPISAFIFGTRRGTTVPLVYQPRTWNQGVLVAAMMSSETTAAAIGQVGVLRHDPMAMLPFCGYNMADYWGHWIEMGKRHKNMPKVFRVNWFNTDSQGKFMWPGFGENIRVLEWILQRIKGSGKSVESAIGDLPAPGAVDMSGLGLSPETERALITIDLNLWRALLADRETYLKQFGDHVPPEIWDEHRKLSSRLNGK